MFDSQSKLFLKKMKTNNNETLPSHYLALLLDLCFVRERETK